jgi:hypothetical protein
MIKRINRIDRIFLGCILRRSQLAISGKVEIPAFAGMTAPILFLRNLESVVNQQIVRKEILISTTQPTRSFLRMQKSLLTFLLEV